MMENNRSSDYKAGITAHRGSSGEAPENTLAAIERAITNGASHVEIDVQLTADGKVILLHDKTFKRTGGIELRPDQMTLAEIRALEVGGWFDPIFHGEPVPTLEEVVELAKNKVILNIELKSSDNSPLAPEAVVSVIEASDLVDQCVVTCKDYEALKQVEILNPRIKTGYIMAVAMSKPQLMDVDFYSVESSAVDHEFVNKAHSIGREVHAWTVNDRKEMVRLLELGVDNIITDYDRLLYGLIHNE